MVADAGGNRRLRAFETWRLAQEAMSAVVGKQAAPFALEENARRVAGVRDLAIEIGAVDAVVPGQMHRGERAARGVFVIDLHPVGNVVVPLVGYSSGCGHLRRLAQIEGPVWQV